MYLYIFFGKREKQKNVVNKFYFLIIFFTILKFEKDCQKMKKKEKEHYGVKWIH